MKKFIKIFLICLLALFGVWFGVSAIQAYKKGENGWHRVTKRLIEINKNDCWWIEGDNQEVSRDSKDYGWVCPDERKFIGVVKLD